MVKRKTLKQYKFSGRQLLLTAVAFGVVGGVVGWAVFAAPQKPNSATLSGPVMVTDKNSDGLANWGDTITFNVTDSGSFASVSLNCYQNGNLEYTATRGFYPGYFWSDNYILENQYWTGGAADCTATLYHTTKSNKNITDATLSFHVNA